MMWCAQKWVPLGNTSEGGRSLQGDLIPYRWHFSAVGKKSSIKKETETLISPINNNSTEALVHVLLIST